MKGELSDKSTITGYIEEAVHMSKYLKKLIILLTAIAMLSMSINTFAVQKPKYSSIIGGGDEAYFTGSDGKLYVTKTDSNELLPVEDIKNVKMASDDIYGSLWVLDTSGNVYYYTEDQNIQGKFTENTKIDGLQNITSIGIGCEGICALKKDGTVWDVNYNKEVSKVEGLSSITSIAMRDNNGIALKKDGTVWHWCNGSLRSEFVKKIPVIQIKSLTGVKEISAGADCGLALKKDGTVWQWGYNTVATAKPIKVTGFIGAKTIEAGRMTGYAVDSKGFVWTWKQSSRFVPTTSKMQGLLNIIDIAASGKDASDGFSMGRIVAIDKNYNINYIKAEY
jgi:alpha-tubulin suppressor-like RCC1 family protein